MRGGVQRKHDFRATRRWKETRLRILKRDLWRCHWQGPGCRETANEADHVVPVGQGGAKWDESNLVAACGVCNNGRNNPRWRSERGRFFRGTGPKTAPLANLSLQSLPPALVGDYSRNEPNDGAG
jgi:5-methylcytosine-specific restriction endonuclease McrA